MRLFQVICFGLLLGAQSNYSRAMDSPASNPLPGVLLGADAAPSRNLAPGVDYTRYARSGASPIAFHVVAFDLRRAHVRFAVTPAEPTLTADERAQSGEYKLKLTSDSLQQFGADLAINASYFYEIDDDLKEYHPNDVVTVVGTVLAKGAPVSPPQDNFELGVNAMVCFEQGNVRVVSGQTCPAGFTDGVAAGPQLMAHGVECFPIFTSVTPASTALNPRTAMGVSADGLKAWMVVVDGRQEGYSVGMNLRDLEHIFRLLGAADAINLDGGGSSVLVGRDAKGKTEVLSRPIHSGVPGKERPVANNVLVYFK